MGKSQISDASHLAHIRQYIIQYCEGLPDLIRAHDVDALGCVSLNIGKCFTWIGPTLDQYTIVQPLPGAAPLPRVTDLGERLRVLGLEILQNPKTGELQRTIESLKKSLEYATELAKIQAEGKR